MRGALGQDPGEIGEAVLWYTLHPDYWGHGFTTEAARAMVDAGFRALGLHRIWADCDPANVASWRNAAGAPSLTPSARFSPGS